MLKKDDLRKDDILQKESYRGHCRNGTFRVEITDTELYLIDTYWNDWQDNTVLKIKKDEDLSGFKYICNLNNIERIGDDKWNEYDEEDLIDVALDSGGWSYRKLYKRKGAKPNKEKVIKKLKKQIESCKREIQWKEDEIQRIESGEIDDRYKVVEKI